MINYIIVEDETLAQEVLVNQLNKISDLKLCGVFDNALDAIEFIGDVEVDLVFSDIKMPDISGVSLLKSLRNPPLFIFVTGDPQFAIESFALDVLDYILKPVELDRILKAVNKAKAILESRESSASNMEFLIVKDRTSNVIIRYDEIHYIRGNKDFVDIVTEEKVYTIWRKMRIMEEILSPNKQFLRVHKSYIVNLQFAKEVSAGSIKMKGTIEDIPIGAQYREELYRRLGINTG